LAWKQPEQSPGYRQDISALARRIKAYLQNLGMKQKELATASGMPEARVSRILRGGQVRLTEQDINQLALGLKMTPAERDELRYLAWPELYEIDKALKRRDGCVFRVNCELAEQGLPLLGSNFEE
jgi:transcriptional regulator with XRE-family HTH domain